MRVIARRGTRLHREESGAVIAIVILSLTAMMGMTVLVVDVGGLLTLRRQLVGAADSAALAAAQSCALNDAAGAPSQADLLATSNQGDAAQTNYESTGCGTDSSGSVELAYESPKELIFAPLLGAPDSRPVSAAATAVWGPTGGISPVPIEFSVGPDGVIPCAFQAVGTECNYWHDQSADHGIHNNSNWGFMNLETAGTSAGASCPNSGSSDRRDQITGAQQVKMTIGAAGFSYVCVASGHASSTWYSALESQVGKIKYFPVNDPTRMVLTSGKEKYAIIGFVALRIDEVMRGNDPAAIGLPGDSGDCRDSHSFVTNGQFDVDSLGCYSSSPDSISNLELSKKVGRNTTIYRSGVDYAFDPVSHVITWLTIPTPNVSIDFEWANAGSGGRCGSHDPDPNAVCLVTSWQNVQIGGSLPGNGQDFGLRAVRLDG